MRDAARKVLDEALLLNDPDRALVAAELIASLDGPADANVEEAWATEIEGRVAEIESGSVCLVSWQDVRTRISRDILKK